MFHICTFSPCWDLYISSLPPCTSYSPWICWLQCTMTHTLKQLWPTTYNIQHRSLNPCLKNGTGINTNAETLLVCTSIFYKGKLRLLHRIIKEINIIDLLLQIQLERNRRRLLFRCVCWPSSWFISQPVLFYNININSVWCVLVTKIFLHILA